MARSAYVALYMAVMNINEAGHWPHGWHGLEGNLWIKRDTPTACICNNHVQRLQMFTLIVITPLQFELSQSSSNSWHVRQTCQLALTLVTTEIMI